MRGFPCALGSCMVPLHCGAGPGWQACSSQTPHAEGACLTGSRHSSPPAREGPPLPCPHNLNQSSQLPRAGSGGGAPSPPVPSGHTQKGDHRITRRYLGKVWEERVPSTIGSARSQDREHLNRDEDTKTGAVQDERWGLHDTPVTGFKQSLSCIVKRMCVLLMTE